MKKVLAWLLVLTLTAAVSIGATLAYLTDTDEDVNVMTLGKVKIDQLEYERVDDETADDEADVQEFHDNKPLYPAVTEDGFDYTPGDTYVDWDQIGKEDYTSDIWDPTKINNEQDKMVFVKNKGDYDAYVRSVIAFEANGYTVEEFKELFHLNLNDQDWTWEWLEETVAIPNADGTETTNYVIAVATYNEILEPGKLTEVSLSQIALDSIADNADIEGFGDTYQILVKSQAIQADGFTDPETALNEGFGEITADNIPFETDSPIQGIDLRTALHYLNGKTPKITTKVTNVVFGLNEEYPEIVDDYEGTLVDVEQDVPVYAYYVPNGSNYDVYFLANDVVYSPANSKELFMAMTALKTVDTHNFDVSRVVDMTDMFYKCTKLEEIDVSHWDTANVTEMYGTFCNCSALLALDVSDWDVGNVRNFRALFSGAKKLKTLDVSNWDTSSATTFHNIFNSCCALEELKGIENWKTSNVTSLYQAFKCCESLKELNVGSWDMSNVVDMGLAFRGCSSLTTLDIGGWDTGSVQMFNSMFSSEGSNTADMNLVNLDLSDWDTSSATTFAWMFYGCGQLKEMDCSGWDVSNVTTMYHMFADCHNLTSVNFSGWNTASLTNMDGMFNDCRSIQMIDVSDLDTDKVEDMSQIFESCRSLTEIKGLENWDTSKVWDFDQFFLNCTSLEVVDLSPLNTASATQTSSMFQSCGKLKTIYVGDSWDMSKVEDSGGMFSGCVSLVGGNGTVYDENHTDVTYACVDADETPGYLTYKAA